MADKKPFLSITIEKPKINDDNTIVLGLKGSEGMSQLYVFHLHIRHTHDKDKFLEMDKLIGEEVKVVVHDPEDRTSQPLRYVNGFIKAAHMDQLNSSAAHTSSDYYIEIVPKLWFLTQTKDCRIFQDKSVYDIVTQILKDFDIKYDEPRLMNLPYYKYEYCVQYQESYYNFILRLMEREGLYYFFDHTKSGTNLKIADNANYDAIDGKPIKFGRFVPVNERTGKVEEREPVITEWRYHENAHVQGKVVLGDYTYFSPKPSFAEPNPAPSLQPPAGQFLSSLNVFDYPAKFKDDLLEGKKLATVLQQQLQTFKNSYDGLSNCIFLKPGYTFELTGFTDKSHDQRYLITELYSLIVPNDRGEGKKPTDPSQNVSEKGVEFHFKCIPASGGLGGGADAAKSGTGVALDSAAKMAPSGAKQAAANAGAVAQGLLPGSRPFRSPPVAHKPVIYGTQTAVVVGPPGKEVHVDALGRVKILFHWDLAIHHPLGQPGGIAIKRDDRSCWVRVAQSVAGQKWGGQFIPRVGQEVVVTFINGDPDRPLIVGSVYNADHGLPCPGPDLSDDSQPGPDPRSQDNPSKKKEKDILKGVGGEPANEFKMGIRTHSQEGNQQTCNELWFDDTKDQEKVFIKAQKDMLVTAEKSIVLMVGGSVIEITKDGITINGAKIAIG